MKKWKILIIVIIIILVIIVLHFIRNYIIINNIAKKQIKLNNYSLSIEIVSSEESNEQNIEIEQKYKDGKILQVLEKDDSEIFRYWYNEITKELITINDKDLIACIDDNAKDGILIFQTYLRYDGIKNKINGAFCSFISHDKINGKKCYVIRNIMDDKIKEYVSVDSGEILKRVNCDTIIEYKRLEINNVKDNDVSRPNLYNYEVQYVNI